MPIAITYLDGGSGVILTGEGAVTGDEIVEANRKVFARDLAAVPIVYRLFDANGLTSLDVPTRSLHDIADEVIAASRASPDTVVAIYANSDLAFGLGRMWEHFVEPSGWTTNVFRTRAEAVAWLKEEVAKRSDLRVTLA